MTAKEKWFFSIDRGGTFCDVIGVDPGGRAHAIKLLSTSARYEDASLEGVRRLLRLDPGEPIPAGRVSEIRMGTTVATNALLERKGEPTALFITEGFADLLDIGYQNRPDLFAVAIKKPGQLYARVCEVGQRTAADGSRLRPLDTEGARTALAAARRDGLRSVAVVFMHSWIDPADELAVGALARAAGFEQVSLSHALLRRIKIVGRGQTAMVDAYLSPILAAYVDRVRARTGAIPLSFMQSSGGLADADRFTGKDAILSGPAGGVIGVAALAGDCGAEQVIGFDMGGTSTDVCRYGGRFERAYENETAGVRFEGNMLSIETVASGGGSILGFEGERMTVGPESAGADPGPACYGKGGPPTVTDANLVLGRIIPEALPKTFSPAEDRAIDAEAARRSLEELTGRINRRTGKAMSVEEAALGYLRIASEIMAKPIKAISISRGFDIREHTLLAFGGAGALHACSIARILGMRKIIVHPLAGLFSAYGIARAAHTAGAERSVLKPFAKGEYESLRKVFERLEEPLIEKLSGAGKVRTARSLDIRPTGSEGFLTVPDTGFTGTREAFAKMFRRRYGFAPNTDRLEIVNMRAEASAGGGLAISVAGGAEEPSNPLPEKAVVHFDGGPRETPVLRRAALGPGEEVDSPALIADDHCSIIVEDGFTARVDNDRSLVIEKSGQSAPVHLRKTPDTARPDPVMLEVFNHAFMSVAEQMGETLKKTAHSVNMKERLDFSCAVFDPEGGLVANAPHIPVHLGAMGATVKALIGARGPALGPGQAYVTNHPAKGGSHLPDVTVITPVFAASGARPDFFVATRGHHADIGGETPGSMSPFSTSLTQEGVILDNLLAVDGGRFDEAKIRAALAAGPHPARDMEERLSDLTAQIAANHKGETELRRLVEDYGAGVVTAYMTHIQNNAAHSLRLALGRFLEGRDVFESAFTDRMDEGAAIAVRVRIEKGADPPHSHRATVDFAGTSPQLPNSLNAPLSVVRAAVLYVFRTLIERDIPLNDGCMKPVTLRVPRGSMLDPAPDAAVVGGNVETSQRMVDALYGALGIAGASQGTMNNVTLGWSVEEGALFSGRYYETVAGGAGASEGSGGADAVQVHMTNTRITDPEVLEFRFPGLRLRRYAIREGSGGAGRYKGGDGVIREYEITQPCELTILSERRECAPYGMAGGQPGAKGENMLLRGGERIDLGGKARLRLMPGDILRIATPGGGGFGCVSPDIRE